MKETEYRISPYGRKWLIGVGIGYLVLGFTYIDQIQPPLAWLSLILWLYFIIAGIYYIYDGATSYQSLSINEGGIQITHKKKNWNASWTQFSVVEDDLVSFVIRIEKKEFRFVRKSLPKEVLELLKDRTEDLSSRGGQLRYGSASTTFIRKVE